MRFTIISDDGNRIVLRDARLNQKGWYLGSTIKNWFGSPAPREDVAESVGRDGDFWPATITQPNRVVTLSGVICAHSALELAQAVDKINGLMGHTLTIESEDAHGVRIATGFLSDDPDPQILGDEDKATFDLIITCPDPHRYGRWSAYSFPFEGTVEVRNNGNVESYPKVKVTQLYGQQITYLTLTCSDKTVKWTGNADELTLDLAEMVPSSGTVSIDNAFALQPGINEVKISTDGYATLYTRDGWR
jgi:phage-related protein